MFDILKYFKKPKKEYRDYFFYTTNDFTPYFQYGIYPDLIRSIDIILGFEDICLTIKNRDKLTWYVSLTDDEYEKLVKLIEKTNKIIKLEYLQNIC